MSFIRPEAHAATYKWREALIGGVILMVNIQIAAASVGVLRGIAIAGVMLGAALFIEGVRRARFPDQKGGAGVVEVDERQITYFGPMGGGALSIDELRRVKVRTTADGPMTSDFFWEFTDRDGQRLTIPGDAENAAALFDALTALQGADYEAVIRASGSNQAGEFLVWESGAAGAD